MNILKKAPDGGPKSPVNAFFLCEFKGWFSIALLRFDKGGREAFHSHAFNALTWFICGDLVEERLDGKITRYRHSVIPKITKRDNIHRVFAAKPSWCFTIRGPWKPEWVEYHNGKITTFGHGRVIIKETT
jgi:hypothetical protein